MVSRFGHCVFMVKHGLIFLAERVFRILMFSVELEHGGIRELLLIVCKGYRLSFLLKELDIETCKEKNGSITNAMPMTTWCYFCIRRRCSVVESTYFHSLHAFKELDRYGLAA